MFELNALSCHLGEILSLSIPRVEHEILRELPGCASRSKCYLMACYRVKSKGLTIVLPTPCTCITWFLTTEALLT
jgi:hypothetical protein